jgi:hypothetical protein
VAEKEIAVNKYVVRLGGEEREQLIRLIDGGKDAAPKLLKADASEAGEWWSARQRGAWISSLYATTPTLFWGQTMRT